MPTERPDPRLEELVEAIVKIAGGNMDTRIAVSPARDQLDAVIAGFNMMAEELKAAQLELEEKINARTLMLTDSYRTMELMALTDPLTQLRNRSALETALESGLAEVNVNGAPIVLLLDLDSFKGINDSMGHAAGDSVLKVVAERLRASVSRESIVARLGGDEFAIVLQGMSVAEARKVGERIVSALAAPMTVEGMELSVEASVGIATSKPDDSALDVILYADTAMYTAKRGANGKVVVFSPHLLAERIQHTALANELENAVVNGQMVLEYQPIVELATGKLLGVEALVRWQHPVRGLLMPDVFIGTAEEKGLLPVLAAHVLRTALAQFRQWRDTLGLDSNFTMRVNISATQLQRQELLDDVERILAEEGINPASLVLELTEYSMVSATEGDAYTFRGLRNLGVGLAIDDFGTGYSSISYLRTLPVNAVKLDRSLLGCPAGIKAQRRFIAAVLELIRSCELSATCEGVETADQAAMLHELGCETGQGYYFSRPVPASGINAELMHWLAGAPWLRGQPSENIHAARPRRAYS